MALTLPALWLAAPAHAACTNPAGPPGMIVYNQDQHVPQYCEGASWRAVGPMPGAGGAGCSNPSGVESVILYNAGDRVMQYCDGTDWIAMGPVQADVTDGLVGHWTFDTADIGISATAINTGALCAGATGATYSAWTNPANTDCTSNNTRATEGTNGDRQDWYNFGVAIPDGSVIEGIEVSVEASSATGGTSVSADIDLSWDGGTNFTAVKTATRSATADSTVAHGGAADTWGRTWTASEFSDSNFRLRLTKGGTAGTNVRVDTLSVTCRVKIFKRPFSQRFTPSFPAHFCFLMTSP